MILFKSNRFKVMGLCMALAWMDCAYAQVKYYEPSKAPQEINESDSDDEQAIVRMIQNQLQAIKEGNYQKAYGFTSAEFRNVTTAEDFSEFVKHYLVFSQNKGLNRQNVFLRKVKIGTFEGSLEGPDGVTLRVEYNLIREGNDWKIIGIKLYHPGEIPKIPLPTGNYQVLQQPIPQGTPMTPQSAATLQQIQQMQKAPIAPQQLQGLPVQTQVLPSVSTQVIQQQPIPVPQPVQQVMPQSVQQPLQPVMQPVQQLQPVMQPVQQPLQPVMQPVQPIQQSAAQPFILK